MSNSTFSRKGTTPSIEAIKKGTIIKPSGGWEEQTYYIVDVAFSAVNVIHRTIFYSGFLSSLEGDPSGYNLFVHSEDTLTIEDAYYMKVIIKINLGPDMEKCDGKD